MRLDLESILIHRTPDFIKPSLRPLYYWLHSTRPYQKIARIIRPTKSIAEVHQYWSAPTDDANQPQEYLKAGKELGQFLVKVVGQYCNPQARILELGCNAGRNLNSLFLAGFQNLEAVEINKNAIMLLKDTYPEMAEHTKIHSIAIEDVIGSFETNAFDLVFTMGVLMHIHPKSEEVFSQMVRIAKKIVTIENEDNVSWGIFPRKYKKIFESLGMKQIEGFRMDKVSGFGGDNFFRIFQKQRKSPPV